jgi:ribonuclease P/MRP protein subunit RPP1
MQCTDAMVCPYPMGSASLRRMAVEAEELGFDSIVALTDEQQVPQGGITVLRACIVTEDSVRSMRAKAKKAFDSYDLVVAEAGDRAFNRAAVSHNYVHLLRNLYRAPKGSFDHITARFAAENSTGIDINLHPIIMYSGPGRQNVLQCYADIIRLHRKLGFPVTISSGAKSVCGMRSVRSIKMICSLFGMTGEEVDAALGAVARIIDPGMPAEVVP